MAYHKYLSLDGMGIFLWFQMGWWNKDTRQQRIEEARETLEWFAKKGITTIDYFAWLFTDTWDNAHFAHLHPYARTKKPGRPFQLNRIRTKWLRSIHAWNDVLLQSGCRGRRCDNMARYCYVPFQAGRNVNGVRGFFDKRALQYQVALGLEINRIEYEVYGAFNLLSWRGLNEPSHHEILPGFDYTGYAGRLDGGLHAIHDWLRDYYEEAMSGYVGVNRVVVDTSLCEANPFIAEEPCPKCTTRTLGNDKYLTATGKRQYQLVNHGYSVPKNVGPGYDIWLGGNFPPPHVHWWGGDGGAGAFKELAKGHKLYDPEGRLIWAQGDPQQTRQLCNKIFQPAAAKGRLSGYQITCFETLQGWPWIENFKLSEIHRGRINAAVNAYKTAYGD